MKRAALYVRVSSQEQKLHGLSVDSQISALREFCSSNGYQEVGLYNDAGISARKHYSKRPALLQMISDCKAGKIDIILMTKLDRFFRSVPDYYAVMEQIGQVPWRAIWEDYETETSAGVFKVNIMLSVAQAEADRTSERIKAVNEFRRDQGAFMGGKAPLGYQNKKGVLVYDEAMRPVVSGLFKNYLESFSTAGAIAYLKENGINVRRSYVGEILTNEVYCGASHGKSCPAYISVADHDLIVDTIRSRRTRTPKDASRVYIFAGLVRCGVCGCAYAGKVRRRKSKGSDVYDVFYPYYVCGGNNNGACDNGYGISERKLEDFLLSNLEAGLDQYRVEIETRKANSQNTQKKLQALEAKLKRVGVRYEDGDLSTEDYRMKRDALKNEIASLKAELPSNGPAAVLPEDWRAVYDALDLQHRHVFWCQILKEITVSPDKSIKFRFR